MEEGLRGAPQCGVRNDSCSGGRLLKSDCVERCVSSVTVRSFVACQNWSDEPCCGLCLVLSLTFAVERRVAPSGRSCIPAGASVSSMGLGVRSAQLSAHTVGESVAGQSQT